MELLGEAGHIHPDRHEASFDYYLIRVLGGRATASQMIDLSQQQPICDTCLRYPLQLTGRKLAIVRNETRANAYHPKRYHLYHNLLPWKIASGVESAYWYAECLAVACAVGAQWGYPYQQALRTLRETYENLGRLDRWEYLRLALDVLPDSYDEFAKHLAYLLTW